MKMPGGILHTLIERYIQGGLDEILDPEVFKLPPIRREGRSDSPNIWRYAAVCAGAQHFDSKTLSVNPRRIHAKRLRCTILASLRYPSPG